MTLDSGSSIVGGLIEIADRSRMNAVAGGATISDAIVSVGKNSDLSIHTLTLKDSILSGTGTTEVTKALSLINTDVTGGLLKVSGQYDGMLAIGGHVELNGSVVELAQGGRIASNGSATSLANFSLITGNGGLVGDEHMILVNHGTITVDALSGASMVLDTGDDRAIFNHGLIAASVADTTVTIKTTLDNQSLGELLSGSGTVATANLNNEGLVEASGAGHIVVQGRLSNSGRAFASAGATLEAASSQNIGKAIARGDDSILMLGTSGVALNGGQITAKDGGTVTFGHGVDNVTGGQLVVEDGGRMEVTGAATGGIARILGDGSILEFEGSSTANTTTNAVFGKVGLGQLMLNNSSRFTGTVAEFAAGDTIDVTDVAFVAGKNSYNESTGVLTIGEGVRGAKIQLLGQYTAADFAFASDGHGGTLVTGTATADPAAAIATMLLTAHG
jgi:hypothetical protein